MRPHSIHLLLAIILPLLCLTAACTQVKDDRPNVAQTGGGIAQLDAERGLPDATIGAPLADFSGLVTVEELGKWGTYRRPSDRLRYQRWPVDQIIYHFYEGRLYSIRMELSDQRSVKGILTQFYRQYGPETTTQRRRFQGYETTQVIREWDGEKVDLTFSYASDFSGGSIVWVDSVLWNKLNAGRQASSAELRDALSGSMLNLDFD